MVEAINVENRKVELAKVKVDIFGNEVLVGMVTNLISEQVVQKRTVKVVLKLETVDTNKKLEHVSGIGI